MAPSDSFGAGIFDDDIEEVPHETPRREGGEGGAPRPALPSWDDDDDEGESRPAEPEGREGEDAPPAGDEPRPHPRRRDRGRGRGRGPERERAPERPPARALFPSRRPSWRYTVPTENGRREE